MKPAFIKVDEDPVSTKETIEHIPVGSVPTLILILHIQQANSAT